MKKRILAGVAAALLFVCGVFGTLSWMPVAGGMLKPLTVHAADCYAELNDSTLKIYNDPNNPIVIDINDPARFRDKALLFASPLYGGFKNGDNITLIVTGDVQIGRIESTGSNLTITGNGKLSCAWISSTGELVIEDAKIETHAKTTGMHGIYARNALTIKNSTVTAQSDHGDGIKLHTGNGGLLIENSTVTATGVTNGINCDQNSGGIRITSGSKVTANGSTGNGMAAADGYILIDNGTTVDSSGGTNGISVGNNQITIQNGANVKATGTSGYALNAQNPNSITAPGYDPNNLSKSFVSGAFAIVSAAPAAAASSCATGHASYTWQTVTTPDVHNDGEIVFMCSACGHVLYRVPLSAYGPFQEVTAEKIRNAAPGATVEITTSRWISFHRSVMEALAARPDVTFTISFLDGEYRGNRRIVTIPAGYDTLSLLNGTDYCGFLYLGSKFGLK